MQKQVFRRFFLHFVGKKILKTEFKVYFWFVESNFLMTLVFLVVFLKNNK